MTADMRFGRLVEAEHVREPLLRHLVGGILRRTRLRQGRTLQEVAGTARMSTAYLSEVERGRKEASSEVLAAVCAALGIRLVDLVAQAHDALAAGIEQQERVRVLTSVRERPSSSARHVRSTTTSDVVALAA
ncbi:helix-turn-helix domain-containing protein [Krasilnikoviella flava]|uniref:Helix-turn-helix domain-containing protein n=1 Tax=Krasilnikoviella flava TaxID=526729 RepID=A0A1T5IDD2_9MICO|nr:helix-turn-helix transcriptional regulator [Krasilnikoviella flava]SKC37058.1 Helix-turn-helix domain-containing protein [Krasilnikoviella flava]